MRDQDITGFPSTPPNSIPGQTIGPGGIDTNMVKGSYSISTFGYADNFDATYNFILPFYIDQNVTAINQVILNLLFQKYRAFSKASTAESAHTHNVVIPNHTHNITGKATGGDDSAHQHIVLVQCEESAGTHYSIVVDPGALAGPHGDCTANAIGQLKAVVGADTPGNDAVSFKTNCTIDPHTHPISGIATDGGGGDTIASAAGSAHTHALTFGIYEAAAYPTNVGILVDAVDRTATLGGAWNPTAGNPRVVNLDLTKYITDIGAHSIELSTDDMGRCIPMLWIKTQSKK